MHPILIDLGTYDLPLLGETHLFLPTYGFLFAAGTLIAWTWFMRRARTTGISADSAFNLSFYTLLAGLLGAKLTLIALDFRYYFSSWENLVGSVRSAGVLMGGVLLAALTFVLYCARTGLPTFKLGDAIAAPLALAQGIGRLGCWCAGCCYGVPTESWFSVTFTDPQAIRTGIPLVPIQFLQSLSDLLLAGLLTWLWRRRVQPAGTVFWIYLLAYCVSRAVLELWRGDTARGLFLDGAVSTSQLFSVLGVVIALVMLFLRRGARDEAVA